MKVGTDGVLLGAWADCRDAKNILDVGTGSGLIALMLAQRSDASITAIDSDENACKQAQINFDNSPFSDRLTLNKIAYQDYLSSTRFDLIVSNPPYFLHSLKSPDRSRTRARHSDDLPFEDLLKTTSGLLSSQGKLAIILPWDSFESFDDLAWEQRLFLNKKTNVYSLPGQKPKRLLLEYSTKKLPIVEDDLFIEKSQKLYSEEYIHLTRDFYLGT
jgi:tRNA1Val (adenine37-N6)-methyltransferase